MAGKARKSLLADDFIPTEYSTSVICNILGGKWEHIYEVMREEAPGDEPTMSWEQVKAELRASIDREFDGFDDESDDEFDDYDEEGVPQ